MHLFHLGNFYDYIALPPCFTSDRHLSEELCFFHTTELLSNSGWQAIEGLRKK